jgi:hypothetical protein
MYDSDTSAVTAALTQANPTVFSSDTIDRILALATKSGDTKVTFADATPDASGNVTVAAGAEVVLVNSSNTTQTTIKPPVNAPVVIFQGKGGVIVSLNDGITTPNSNQSQVDRVIVGSAGNDNIIVADAKNTQITLGTGNSSVVAGGGVDTIAAGLGNSTIAGGTGDYAVVKLAGSASNYTVSVNNGHAIVTGGSSNKVTDITKIQYVQLDSGQALVFAKDSVEASVATLYHTTFGRDADAGGLDYWFDLARAGASLKQIATAFASSAEFAPKAALSDADFIASLYQNTFGRAGEAGGLAYWADALANGTTRADLMNNFASIAGQSLTGSLTNNEATVQGHVTVVTGIV